MKRSLLIAILCLALVEPSLKLCAQTITDNVSSTTIKQYKLEKGRHNTVFRVRNSQKINTDLSIPEIKQNETVPLIIALHWAGGPNTYMKYGQCLAFPALEFMNAIIVAPSDNGLHWVHEQNEKNLIKLIDDIIKHWPVDKSKIIITGYSNGGIGSWYYAEKYPNLFCAAIPMAGSYNASEITIPLYVIHGKKDELFNTYKVQNIVTQSIAKGSQIHLTLVDNYSHFTAFAYAETLYTVAKILEEDVFQN